MKTILAIAVIILFNSHLLAAKTYNVTVRTYSLATNENISGLKIYLEGKKSRKVIGYTNEQGEILITAINENSIVIIIEDSKGMYRAQKLHYSILETIDERTSIGLRFNDPYETAYFMKIDSLYNYKDSVLKSQQLNGSSKTDSSLYIPTSFVGGIKEFQKFLYNNLEYPPECAENGINGIVYLKFIVESDGTISNVVVTRGVNYSMDSEAIKLLRYSPKWIPETIGGKPVRSYFTTKVKFQLS